LREGRLEAIGRHLLRIKDREDNKSAGPVVENSAVGRGPGVLYEPSILVGGCRQVNTTCYHDCMYSQKFKVDVVIRGERRACPLEWLDQFCMRNFTNAVEFDDTLPVGEGRVEASFRVTPERFAESFGAWLTQRGKGEGQPVQVEVSQVAAGS
jgi:hypothetical protein